ncbi:MAG TPA: hypothetical protein VKB88_14730 [Bryobacteraceae bacterium]|nr:hypothetical protein [Bryobacteraceae bacterium]
MASSCLPNAAKKKEAERVLDQLRQNPLTNSLDVAIVNAGL